MELYGRPGPQRTSSSPAVVFLNERPKSLSFSSTFKPPGVSRGRSEDEFPQITLPDRPSNQQNQQQPLPLHQRPASSRFLNRPQSSTGVRRQESFEVQQASKQRPRTARDGTRIFPTTTPTFVKKKVCFAQEDPEVDGQITREELSKVSSSNLEEQYLQQLKADILHLHSVHQQLESESENNGDRLSRSAGTQEPNHVKNLLLQRDTKAFLGWGSQDLKQDFGASSPSASIQALLLQYNFSSDSAQLNAAKAGLEGLLADTLVSLMEFCLVHDSSGSDENAKMKLIRPPTRQQNGDGSTLPFANGCGTSAASIYAGGMLSVLQQTEVLKRTMLASTGEKKNLVKTIADKDEQLLQLTEQIEYFKDTLARRRLRLERQKQVIVHYDEREAPESAGNGAAGQSISMVSAEQLARLEALEKDRVESLISMKSLEQQKDELEQQLETSHLELQGALDRLEIAEQQHQESLAVANKTSHKQVAELIKQATDLQSSLASLMERHRSLEATSVKEKSQLRRDKQELERLIRLKENEVGQRQAQDTAKAEALAQSVTAQLQIVTKQLNQAKEELRDLQSELKAAQTDNKHIQGTIHSLNHDLKVRSEDVNILTSKLAAVQATAESKAVLLQSAEARIEVSSKEIENQRILLEKQAQQLQQLETKLSRSVPVDDEELRSRQQREESKWHQRVSTLEHALIAERQNTALFREQQRKAVVMEQEKATHAVEQAQAVAAELATANLCLLERKRQRAQEQTAFEQKLKVYVDQVAELASDKGGLERQLDTLKTQYEHLEQSKAQSADEAAAKEKMLQEELATVKEELKSLTDIRENLDKALAHALATPRGKSVRYQASLSEARAELQKAKHKITVLEEQLSRNGNIRTTEIDGKLAQLCARERRVAEEQRGLKKQRADATAERRKERVELDQQREAQEAIESKQKTDHKLLQEIIVLLTQRLQVMTALFKTEPVSAPPNSESKNLTAQDVESWREMQQHWETLHQELLSVDWKLEDMRIQLEALLLEYVGDSVGKHQSSLSDFHGPNPFSDAVAAGRDTVPVAEQLKANLLLRRLSCPGESLKSRARQVKAEEHDTFALALAREMTAMKQGYEKQLEELRAELCKTQQLRLLTSQRLRSELATERTRRQQIVEQLTQRIEELEEALRDQERALAVAQTQQEAILDQYAASTCHDDRERALQELVELVGGEQRRRERERLSKLLSYCGASSVTVERRDRSVEEETVDEVLARLDAVDDC